MASVTENTSPVDELHIYEPHRAGLPKLGPYTRQLWARREFAAEFSRAGIRAANTQTLFGQLWLVLNPTLLALVYYVLVSVIRQSAGGFETLAHITCGLFLFYFVSGSITQGAQSVTGGGKLIMNMNFPRLLLPFAAVRTAFFRFLPTVPVYFLIHILAGGVWSPQMLLASVFLGLTVIFCIGMAAIFATVQVYFRDTSSFLPYLVRIWLYLSPVLWFADEAPEQFQDLMVLNPLYSLIGSWTDLLLRGIIPEPKMWLAASIWAVLAFVGGSLLFMSREREFTVRL
ncbi:ABC transporter permease [Occultella glacieicola]|uniref:ABC transporter permease n=1 Tax=Occultella glacieicola TaxID=2518684 RepID=A0ABY2E6D2_9MICO|nr:ABC transporter permease [Occultella glacieicola]TDE96137.1 ABC transporter permease [Occultella glacieicola]